MNVTTICNLTKTVLFYLYYSPPQISITNLNHIVKINRIAGVRAVAVGRVKAKCTAPSLTGTDAYPRQKAKPEQCHREQKPALPAKTERLPCNDP